MTTFRHIYHILARNQINFLPAGTYSPSFHLSISSSILYRLIHSLPLKRTHLFGVRAVTDDAVVLVPAEVAVGGAARRRRSAGPLRQRRASGAALVGQPRPRVHAAPAHGQLAAHDAGLAGAGQAGVRLVRPAFAIHALLARRLLRRLPAHRR